MLISKGAASPKYYFHWFYHVSCLDMVDINMVDMDIVNEVTSVWVFLDGVGGAALASERYNYCLLIAKEAS